MTIESENYWQRLCRSNPQLANENAVIKLSVAEFRKQVCKAFLDGAQSELDDLRSVLNESGPKTGKEPHFIMDAFDSVFGKGFRK